MTLFQYHLLGLALTALSMLGFGSFVFLKNPRRPLNRAMAFYCASIAWWSGWECAALQMPTRELAFLLMRVEYIGVAFIPTLFCTTVSYLLDYSSDARRRFLFPLYLFSMGALLAFTVFTPEEFFSASPGPVYYLPMYMWAGPYHWVFLVPWFAIAILGHAAVFLGWRRARGPDRTRLTLFLWGTLLAYVGGCPEFALKYGIRLGWLNPFGLYAFPAYIGILTYAVVQHQFFDIRVVIRKSLVYSLLITVLTASYFGLVYGVERIVQAAFGYHSPVVSLAAFALMALVFQPLKIAIQRGVDWLVFRVPQQGLARRLEALEREVQEADKARAVGRLAAGIAHEIKNPLTALRTYLEFLPERQADPQFMGQFRQVVGREMERLEYLARGLLDFAKPRPTQCEFVDLRSVLDQVALLTKPDLLGKGVTLDVRYGHNGATLVGDPGQLSQVFLNLILNARDAMSKGGTLTVETQSDANGIVIRIADTGQGIAPHDLPHLFEPFFTRKSHGTGLGLSIVQQILQDHGGAITVTSAPGRGTTFTVRLPSGKARDQDAI